MVKSLFILMFVSYPAFALDCGNVYRTIDLDECGRIELNKLDRELNQTYKYALNSFDKIGKDASGPADKSKLKQSLIQAQRFWVKYRDADCGTTYTLWSDGTIRGQMYLGCMISKTQERIKELKQYGEYGINP